MYGSFSKLQRNVFNRIVKNDSLAIITTEIILNDIHHNSPPEV